GIPLIVVSRNVQTPGFEGVIDAHQRGVQLREVTVQHVHHGVVFYPVITFLSVNFRGVVRGEEAVRNDTAGGVHDENLERGFAEGKAFRTYSFRHHADQGVDHFNVVVIHALQVGQSFRIFGQIFKLGDRVQANLTTEFVVTRYTTLTVTDYVDSGDVHFADDRQIQITQEFRVVVQYQGARVGDTEGVPQTVRTFTVQHVFGGAVTGFFQGNALVDDVGTDVVNIDIVTHQRVHTVNRDEFFGQGKGNTGVVRLTRTSQTGNRPLQEVALFHGFRQFRVNTQDATDPGIFFGQIFIDLVQFGAVLVTIVGVTSQTQTVGVHGTLGNRVGNDGRRPFNRVNFRHQGGVDQTGFVVQPLIIFIRVAGRQCLSNSVVLFYEQLVQHAQTDPPVIHKTGFRQAREEFTRQGAIGIHGQTTALEFTDAVGGFQITAVNLRAIPPVGNMVLIAVWQVCFRGDAGGIRLGTTHFQSTGTHAVAGRQRHFNRVFGAVFAMEEPVVGHELNPAGSNEVNRGGRFEIIATGQQYVTDFTRVRS